MSPDIQTGVSGNSRPVATHLSDFEDLIADRDAALDPELAEWVEDSETFGTMLRHPLVYQIPLSLRGMANRCLHQKKQAVAEAAAEGDWSSVIWLHERAYRLRALVDYCLGRRDDDTPLPLVLAPAYWTLAAEVWVDSENIGQVMDEWRAVIGDDPVEDGLWLGTPEERAEFDALPDPITAWRGEIDDGGWSYTTDESIAHWFANRFEKTGVIQEMIPKSRVFGYLTRRGESELLVQAAVGESVSGNPHPVENSHD